MNRPHRLDDALRSRWYQEASEGRAGDEGAAAVARIRINVGGQLFETTARVLRRDPGSALAELAERPAPTDAEDGAWFFERDWWTFRFVLQWLREGETSLPRSKQLLKALYAEARFFGMIGLRDAVRRVYQRIAAAEAEADAPALAGPEPLERQRAGAAASAAPYFVSYDARPGAARAAPKPGLSGHFEAGAGATLEELLRAGAGAATPLSVVSASARRRDV